MTDPELDRLLKAAVEPALPAGYWDAFPRSIRVQLRSAQGGALASARRRFRLGWVIAPALACVIVAVSLVYWRGRSGVEVADSFLQNRKDVRDMPAMFPNQVRAIVQDSGGMNLVLSDQPDVPDSPALYIHVCDGTHCSTVVTFSGQEVEIAGQKITALSDAKGGVILVGDHFLWSKEEPQRPSGQLRIEARELDSTGAS